MQEFADILASQQGSSFLQSLLILWLLRRSSYPLKIANILAKLQGTAFVYILVTTEEWLSSVCQDPGAAAGHSLSIFWLLWGQAIHYQGIQFC